MLNTTAYSQLIVNTAIAPTTLVQNVLLGGGVTVSNITYTGGPASLGSFSNGNTTNLGLNNGVVLCTGNAIQINNQASTLMSLDLKRKGDTDLDNINNGCLTYDATILEFDFIPLSDTVEFRYVFGSEEYPNYVCSVYNDVFAFFLTGPNPIGGNYSNYNLALIPGTSIPVSVNSINNGKPGGGYPSSGCTSLAHSNYYVDNAAQLGKTIAFGGFTKPLTAICHVKPCEKYHIKIAVADGFNGLYDSGVFLEANSFFSNTYHVTASYSAKQFGNVAVEGCSKGLFSFKLSSPATAPYVINYTLSGTAVNGVDYTQLPGTITIPAGKDSATITVNPINDIIQENIESVIINYNTECVDKTDTIFIANYNSLNIKVSNDTTICSGSSASLKIDVSNGKMPYNYQWSNSLETSDKLTTSPVISTTYLVTVTDACSQTATESIDITVNSVSATFQKTNAFCGQQNGSATVIPSGSCNTSYSYLWNTNPNVSGQSISNLSPGEYTVTVTCGLCPVTAKVTIDNIPGPEIVIDTLINDFCLQNTGSISIRVLDTNTYSYIWNTNPVQTTSTINNLKAGTYTITASHAGCSISKSITVNNTPGSQSDILIIPEIITINEGEVKFEGISDGTIAEWLWDFGDGYGDNNQFTQHYYQNTGIYQVTLITKDNNSCKDTVVKTVTVQDIFTLIIPNTFSPNGDGVNDMFYPKGMSVDTDDYEMLIVDRWGNIIFQTNQWEEGWNGTKHNKGTYSEAIAGVYTYKIFAGRKGAVKHNYFGTITLLK